MNMTCDFTSFSEVFQLYQDDGRLIMKDCVQWNYVYGGKDFASSGDRAQSARSVSENKYRKDTLYSRTSVARTMMARLPRLFRTRS